MTTLSEEDVRMASDTLHNHSKGALTCYDHDTGWCCECGTHELLIPWREHAARAVLKALNGRTGS